MFLLNFLKLQKTKFLFVAILLFIVLFLLFCGTRGLDLTDQFYIISNNNLLNTYYFPIWGTVLVTNFFKLIFGNYTYIVLKVFAQFIPGTILYLTIRLFKNILIIESELKLYLLLALTWVGRSELMDWLYYSTLSGLLISLAIIMFHFSFLHRSKNFFYVSSSLIVLSIFVKVTNLIFLVLIPISFFLGFYNSPKYQKPKIINFFFFFIITFIFLYSFDQLGRFFKEGAFQFLNFIKNTETHSFLYLLEKNFLTFFNSFQASIYLSIPLVILYFIEKFFLNRKYSFIFSIVTVLFSITVFKIYNVLNIGEMFVFYVFMYFFICYRFVVNKDYQSLHIVLLSFLFLMFSSIGSNNGLRASCIAEPLTVFVLVLSTCKFLSLRLIGWVCFLLFLLGLDYKISFPYRDLNRFSLNAKSNITSLLYVKSNNSKMKALESIYQFKNTKFKEGSTALIYPSAPILFYLLGLEPFLDNPWINLYNENILENLLQKVDKKPDYIIKLKQNTRNKNWPNSASNFKRDLDYKSTLLLNQYIAKNNFILSWSNKHFEVFLSN